MSQCVKINTLGRLCDDNLERFYNHFITTNVYFIGAVYNSYFLIIYKPSTLIISPRTFSIQLGAGTAWFCLSQCTIPFCTLSADRKQRKGEEYRVGDLVLLSMKDLKWQMKRRRSEKLTERFIGPYKIKEIISSNAVELELPKSIRIHPVVNISRV